MSLSTIQQPHAGPTPPSTPSHHAPSGIADAAVETGGVTKDDNSSSPNENIQTGDTPIVQHESSEPHLPAPAASLRGYGAVLEKQAGTCFGGRFYKFMEKEEQEEPEEDAVEGAVTASVIESAVKRAVAKAPGGGGSEPTLRKSEITEQPQSLQNTLEPRTLPVKELESDVKDIPAEPELSAERLKLREVMTTMRKERLGSRAAMKTGLEYIMTFWTVANISEYELKGLMKVFNTPGGKGLAEVSQGSSSFMRICIRIANLDMVKELVEVGGLDLTTVDPGPMARFLESSIEDTNGDSSILEYLIAKTDFLHCMRNFWNKGLMHHAIAGYHLAAVKTLISAGFPINFTVERDWFVMRTARRKRRRKGAVELMVEILNLLLDAGANVKDSIIGASIKPVMLVGMSGIDEVLDILREKGVEDTVLRGMKDFELSVAIWYRDLEDVKRITKEGRIDLNKKDILGRAPIDFATDKKIKEVLTAAGARSKLWKNGVNSALQEWIK
ncbi:hypothetical protein ABW20_dc0102455 [Dactylellina cionopaga]|nr:hypothetical protein ABW20_dc0102455 [Dactylellina cionopaga]